MTPSAFINVQVNGTSVGLFHETKDNNEMNEAMYKSRSSATCHNTGNGVLVGHRRCPADNEFKLSHRARIYIKGKNQRESTIVREM